MFGFLICMVIGEQVILNFGDFGVQGCPQILVILYWVGWCNGENPPNLGLSIRKSLDALKDIKYSILPQAKHNLMIINGRERR
jgi:hypothetical protein